MMFFSMIFEDTKVVEDFGIIKPSGKNNYAFDTSHQVNLDRLSRFITFDMKLRKKKPG